MDRVEPKIMRCPRCGMDCEVITTDEGTSYYAPLRDTERLRECIESLSRAARAEYRKRVYD